MNRSYGDILANEAEPGLGNGGLGRLASCILDSLATHSYPAQAYGLRYQYGTFEQQIWDGLQIEAPDCWLLSEDPWEFRRDARRVVVKYAGTTTSTTNIHGDEILLLHNFEEVSSLPYDIPILGYAHDHTFSVVTLRLWSTKESPRNFQLQRYNAGSVGQAAENTTFVGRALSKRPSRYRKTHSLKARVPAGFGFVARYHSPLCKPTTITFAHLPTSPHPDQRHPPRPWSSPN